METTKIRLKDHPQVETQDFFKVTDRVINDLPKEDPDVYIVIQDYTRIHNQIVGCIIHRIIEKIGEDRTHIVVASGMHRACSQSEINAMLGSSAASQRLRIHYHNPFHAFPSHLLEQNYVLGIHITTPHNHLGMSRAGKMIAPGLSSLQEALKIHALEGYAAEDLVKSYERLFNYVFDICVDAEGNIINAFSGMPGISPYQSYLRESKKLYEVKIPDELPDVAILKPYIKNEDFILTMNAMNVCIEKRVVKEGGTLVIHNPVARELGVHYLFMQPNGTNPVYYDDVFRIQLGDVLLVFLMYNLEQRLIQTYFKRQIFNFPNEKRFFQFIESLHGENPLIHEYDGSDIMIGV